jgi:hypothetical protein
MGSPLVSAGFFPRFIQWKAAAPFEKQEKLEWWSIGVLGGKFRVFRIQGRFKYTT